MSAQDEAAAPRGAAQSWAAAGADGVDFYRLKFKREAKMKATPPNSVTNTPHSSPPRKTTTGTAPPRTAVDGAGGSFARAAGGESTAAGPGVGYEEEVSWSVRTRASS